MQTLIHTFLDTNLGTCIEICRNIQNRTHNHKDLQCRNLQTQTNTQTTKNIYINTYTHTENCRHSQTQAQISVADQGFRKKEGLHVRIKYLSHFGAKCGVFKLFL
jgi:hypothetical protein